MELATKHYSLGLSMTLLGGLACCPMLRAGNGSWDSKFNVVCEQSGQIIKALAVDGQGRVFVGGTLSSVGGRPGTPVTNIAMWDGQIWSSPGTGVNGVIQSIVCSSNDVYVGGVFTSAGGVAATNLARWDGTSWWAVGGGVPGGGINVLAIQAGLLLVGGSFTNAGGTNVQNIAAWDGQNWSSLGNGVSGSGAAVTAILVDGNNVWVGGKFQSAGGVGATNFALWNGSQWTNLANGLIGPAYAITKDDNGNIYAGGGLSAFDDPYISEWNGLTWSNLPAGNPGANAAVRVLFVYTNTLYAGGLYLTGPAPIAGLERFDGTNWIPVPAPFYPVSAGPVPFQNKLYFSGGLNEVMSPQPTEPPGSSYGIGAWDGTTTTLVGSGLNLLVSSRANFRALAVEGTNLIAGGHFGTQVGSLGSVAWSDLVAQWDGSAWSELGSGILVPNSSGSELTALTTDGGVIYAGAPGSTVQAWNGTNWISLGGGLPGAALALAAGGGQVYAGGSFGIQGWDGTNWSALGSGVNGAVHAILAQTNGVFVGGNFSLAGGLPASNIARWDGTNWSSLGSGMDAAVLALAFRGSDLVAGGAFTNAGGAVAPCIAVWNGNAWTNMGGGFSNGLPVDNYLNAVPTSVNSLAVTAQGIVYATGNFQEADGRPAGFIAYWDGAGWQPMGSGLNAIAYALALIGDDAYVGGDFTQAGSKSSSRVALWHGADNTPELQIGLADQGVVLWWPTNIANFVLEGSSDLSAGASWQPVPTTVVGGLNIATNSIFGTNGFFRLQKQ